MKKGFTIAELLVVIAITIIIAGLSINTFVDFSRLSALEGNTEAVVSQLHSAQTQTFGSLNGHQYGVHITATSSTLFTGSIYESDDASNTVFTFYSGVTASATPSDFVFQELSGTTTSGTIVLYASPNQALAKTISIEETGTIDVH